MEKCEKYSCETEAQSKKMDECTEALHGIIVLRKGKLEEREIWLGQWEISLYRTEHLSLRKNSSKI